MKLRFNLDLFLPTSIFLLSCSSLSEAVDPPSPLEWVAFFADLQSYLISLWLLKACLLTVLLPFFARSRVYISQKDDLYSFFAFAIKFV